MGLLDHANKDIWKLIPYSPGKNPESSAVNRIIKLASNECPLGSSPKAVRAIKDNLSSLHRYPDGYAAKLKEKLADYHSLAPENFVIGSGSNEVLVFIGHCFMYRKTSTVMSQHSFVVYKLLATAFGSEIIEVPMNGYTHDLSAMLDAVKFNTRVIFVCNPNNPTGTIVREKEIQRFMNKVPDDILVVFDEAYKEISCEDLFDTVQYVREKRNVVVLRSFSKAYGLAGLRVGYGIGRPAIIETLNKPRQPFNVNSLALVAAEAALDDKDFIIHSKEIYKRGIEYITKACDEMELFYEYPYGNFIFINVGDGRKVTAELQNEGVIVRPLINYDLHEFIRVTLGTESQNEIFIQSLKKVLNK